MFTKKVLKSCDRPVLRSEKWFFTQKWKEKQILKRTKKKQKTKENIDLNFTLDR